MVFSSTEFLFFFLPLLLVIYYLPFIRRTKARNVILLVFSLGFYAWGEPLFIFVMLLWIVVNWAIVRSMAGYPDGSRERKNRLVAAVVLDVLLIGVFKYLSFLTRNLAALTGNENLVLEIALPIGISFFTFQLMSYVFDVYYGHTEAQKSVWNLMLYISFFPQLIAGPIVRYQDIEVEIIGRRESFEDLTEGVRRFAYGLAKKVLIANYCAQIADMFFEYGAKLSVASAWLGALAYTLQIYFDFGGYSDMAIGLGRMFGFHFLENFNYPYIAKSVTDFWRRWHISLSTWFRDYVYIPLGGNRVSQSRWIFNLFVVWLLTGIWHGANWTFILWGLFYFAVLLAEKLTGIDKKAGILSRVYTLVLVMIAWVLFRSESIGAAIAYIGRMFGVGASGLADSGLFSVLKGTWSVLLAGIIGATPLFSKGAEALRRKGLGWIEALFVALLFVLSVMQLVSDSYNPFIYFNF